MINTVDYNNCCVNYPNGRVNIVWLNREGGYQNYIFQGVKTFEQRVGDERTYKDGSILKLSQRKNVYSGRIVTTSNIPQLHVDYLDSLRTSIQAWEWNESDDTYTEILLDNSDYVKYTTRQKLFDISIRFIYAEEIIIQTQ